jgi:TrmH family RNA methyltransferase
VSTLGSGTRVIGVYEQRWGPAVGPLCVYLHGVGDPGNVGTVLRSAEAFGASCVALGPGCADPHGPKAVRASMGAIFTVALARVGDVAELPGERVALLADADEPLRGPGDDRGRGARTGGARAGGAQARVGAGAITLLVGSERDGLPQDVVAACERSARIPIASHSLNAAMAATVALYEMTMRSHPPGRDIDTVRAS